MVIFGLILSFFCRYLYEEKKTFRFNENCALIKNYSRETVALIKKRFSNYFFFDDVWFGEGAYRWRRIKIYCNGRLEGMASRDPSKEFLKISIENNRENQGWDFNPNLFKIFDNGLPENKNFIKILKEKTKESGIIFEIIEKQPEGSH